MKIRGIRRSALGFCAVAAGLLGAACSSSNAVVPGPAAGIGVPGTAYQPHYAMTRSMAAARRFHPDLFVSYHSGPVLTTPLMYIVFWGYKTHGDPDKVKPLMINYAKAMGGSAHNNIYTQYYGMTGKKKTFIGNANNQFGGSWEDDSPIPKSPTDSQVAAEAVKGASHFGFDPNGVYFVATAHNHNTPSFGTNFCSYHNAITSKGKTVPYVDFPYMPDGGSNCGVNFIKAPKDESAKDEGVTIMAGHEYGETLTDPQPFSGWNGVDGEIADPCSWQNIANEPFKNKSYSTQPMISDASGSCVQSYP